MPRLNESRTCGPAMAELPCVQLFRNLKPRLGPQRLGALKAAKFRSFENRALEDPGQQNMQPQHLATWHAQRKHRFFLIEFPLDLERVAPFPAGSYGENPWKVATEARTKLITLRKKSRKKDQRSKSRKAALHRRFNLFQAGQLTCLSENLLWKKQRRDSSQN